MERTFLSTHVLPSGSHHETIPKPWKGPIRIAILDQGVDTANLRCCGKLGIHDTAYEHLIIDQKSWVDDSEDIEDMIHGTTVTSLVLRFGPKAEVYVAQVSRNSRVGIEDAGRIVQVWLSKRLPRGLYSVYIVQANKPRPSSMLEMNGMSTCLYFPSGFVPLIKTSSGRFKMFVKKAR